MKKCYNFCSFFTHKYGLALRTPILLPKPGSFTMLSVETEKTELTDKKSSSLVRAVVHTNKWVLSIRLWMKMRYPAQVLHSCKKEVSLII